MNIGSGVSMIEVRLYIAFILFPIFVIALIISVEKNWQVIGKGKFERIIGSHLGGGTILGLARLLTGCSRYNLFSFLCLQDRGIFLET